VHSVLFLDRKDHHDFREAGTLASHVLFDSVSSARMPFPSISINVIPLASRPASRQKQLTAA